MTPGASAPGVSIIPSAFFKKERRLVNFYGSPLFSAVGAGAAIGGMLRFLVTQLVIARFGVAYAPCATMFINIGGSFLIGAVLELSRIHGLDPTWRFFLSTGIIGGYTTFSTFSYETFVLGTSGSAFAASMYVVGTIALGLIGTIAGIAVAKAIPVESFQSQLDAGLVPKWTVSGT